MNEDVRSQAKRFRWMTSMLLSLIVERVDRFVADDLFVSSTETFKLLRRSDTVA